MARVEKISEGNNINASIELRKQDELVSENPIILSKLQIEELCDFMNNQTKFAEEKLCDVQEHNGWIGKSWSKIKSALWKFAPEKDKQEVKDKSLGIDNKNTSIAHFLTMPQSYAKTHIQIESVKKILKNPEFSPEKLYNNQSDLREKFLILTGDPLDVEDLFSLSKQQLLELIASTCYFLKADAKETYNYINDISEEYEVQKEGALKNGIELKPSDTFKNRQNEYYEKNINKLEKFLDEYERITEKPFIPSEILNFSPEIRENVIKDFKKELQKPKNIHNYFVSNPIAFLNDYNRITKTPFIPIEILSFSDKVNKMVLDEIQSREFIKKENTIKLFDKSLTPLNIYFNKLLDNSTSNKDNRILDIQKNIVDNFRDIYLGLDKSNKNYIQTYKNLTGFDFDKNDIKTEEELKIQILNSNKDNIYKLKEKIEYEQNNISFFSKIAHFFGKKYKYEKYQDELQKVLLKRNELRKSPEFWEKLAKLENRTFNNIDAKSILDINVQEEMKEKIETENDIKYVLTNSKCPPKAFGAVLKQMVDKYGILIENKEIFDDKSKNKVADIVLSDCKNQENILKEKLGKCEISLNEFFNFVKGENFTLKDVMEFNPETLKVISEEFENGIRKSELEFVGSCETDYKNFGEKYLEFTGHGFSLENVLDLSNDTKKEIVKYLSKDLCKAKKELAENIEKNDGKDFEKIFEKVYGRKLISTQAVQISDDDKNKLTEKIEKNLDDNFEIKNNTEFKEFLINNLKDEFKGEQRENLLKATDNFINKIYISKPIKKESIEKLFLAFLNEASYSDIMPLNKEQINELLKDLSCCNSISKSDYMDLYKSKNDYVDLILGYNNLVKDEKTAKELQEKNLCGDIIPKSYKSSVKYEEGQKQAVNVAVGAGTSIITIGATTLIAGPVAGFGAAAKIAIYGCTAAAVGSAGRVGLKASEMYTGGKEYTVDEIKRDTYLGAIDGVATVVISGLAGQAGKFAAKGLGVGVIGNVAINGENLGGNVVTKTMISALKNPTGYQYVGGNFAKRGIAYGTELAIDGGLTGGVENSLEYIYDNKTLDGAGEEFVKGAIGGAIAGVGLGTGFEAVKKGVSTPIKGAKKVLNNFDNKIKSGKKIDIDTDKLKLDEAKIKNNSVEIDKVKTETQTDVSSIKDKPTSGGLIAKANTIGISEVKAKSNAITKINNYSDTHNGSISLNKKFMYVGKSIDENDLRSIVENIVNAKKISEKEVIEVVDKVTAFSNMNAIFSIENYAKTNKIGKIYGVEVGIGDEITNYSGKSLNSYVEYLRSKGLIEMNGKKEAFIMDNAGLNFLKELKTSNQLQFDNFIDKVNNGKIKLAYLDGYETIIDDKIYSFNILNKADELDNVVTKVINEQLKNPNYDVNSGIITKAKTIFGDKINENVKFDKITLTTNKTLKDNSYTALVKRINPNMPTSRQIQATIDVLAHNKQVKKRAILKYFDKFLEIITPENIVEKVRQHHKLIEQQQLKLYKTMDDVVYITAKEGKSNTVITGIYAKANGIPHERILHFDGTSSDKGKIFFWNGTKNVPINELKGKTIVILDDLSGTAGSFVNNEMFMYKHNGGNSFIHLFGDDTNVFFAPLYSTNYAKNKLEDFIVRKNKDFVITTIHDELEINYYGFKGNSRSLLKQKGFTNEEINALEEVFLETWRGNGGISTSIIWPWGVNANSTGPVGLLAEFILPKQGTKANQVGTKMGNKFKEYMNAIIEKTLKL